MSIETIKGDEYSVEYNDGLGTVTVEGTVRLQTADEYEPINGLLQKAYTAAQKEGLLCLDFRQLRFLNSSGINVISRFVIAARKLDNAGLRIIGNQDIYWQQKSLSNLQKLWPKVQIDIQ
jgi:hypothetical protein